MSLVQRQLDREVYGTRNVGFIRRAGCFLKKYNYKITIGV